MYLFSCNEKSNYSFFSRLDVLNSNRHPISISIADRNKIEKEYPYSFEKVIKYDKKSNQVVYHQNIGINDITLHNVKVYCLEVLQHI